MATVHTEYGPGRIIDRETVRGRTRVKVAGEGFEVWLDAVKVGAYESSDDFMDEPHWDGHRDSDPVPSGPLLPPHEDEPSYGDRDSLRRHPDYLFDDDPDSRYARRQAERGPRIPLNEWVERETENIINDDPYADDDHDYHGEASGYVPSPGELHFDDDPDARYARRRLAGPGEDYADEEMRGLRGGDLEGYDPDYDPRREYDDLESDPGLRYDDDPDARYARRRVVPGKAGSPGRLAWAPLDKSNSTELPYNPDPQHHAIGTPGDDGSSTLQPIHHIDADERLTPANSITFAEGEDDGSPEPSRELFAALQKQAIHPGLLLQHPRVQEWVKQYGDDAIRAVLPQAVNMLPLPSGVTDNLHNLIRNMPDDLVEQANNTMVDYTKGHWQGQQVANGINSVDGLVNKGLNLISPGEGWGDLVKDSRVREATPAALLPAVLRAVGPSVASGLLGGGGGSEMGEMADHGEGWGDLVKDAYARPAGLSDRYIDITAGADYHNDPVAQFRHDPDAYINRIGHLMDEGLNPRFAEYMDLVEGDSSVRTAAWKDVRAKAMRLKREGHVTVKDIGPHRIMASVVGDNGTYDVLILKAGSFGGLQEGNPGHSIANWHCGCEWGKWAFRRKFTYVGRLCSHAYASYLTMQSEHMKGKPRQPKRPTKAPKQDRRLTFPYFKGSLHTADALQNGPERLTPELVVNDADDAHTFLDVTTDERKDVGPDDVVSDKDIVHFARVMAACEANDRPYPRQLVAFLARYAGCADDASDDTQSDYEAHGATDANEYLEKIRSDADRKQENDFGDMADRVHKIQDAVEEARAHGVDADRFVAMVKTADPISDLLDREFDPATGRDKVKSTGKPAPVETFRDWAGLNSVYDPETRRDKPKPGTEDLPENSGNDLSNTSTPPLIGNGQGGAPAANSLIGDGGQGGAGVGQKSPPQNNKPGNDGQQKQQQQQNNKSGDGGAQTPSWSGTPGGGAGGANNSVTDSAKSSGTPATSGTVADGGVAGAENGNNAAITKNMLDADGMYTVQKGDTWTDLAQRTTGDMNNYQKMYDAQGGAAGGNIDSLAEGTKINLKDFANDVGNNGLAGNVTNPAGGGADGDKSTVDAPGAPSAGDTSESAAAAGLNAGTSIGMGVGEPVKADTSALSGGTNAGAAETGAAVSPPSNGAADNAATNAGATNPNMEKPASLRRGSARWWLQKMAAPQTGTTDAAEDPSQPQQPTANGSSTPTSTSTSPGAQPASNPATTPAATGADSASKQIMPNKETETYDPAQGQQPSDTSAAPTTTTTGTPGNQFDTTGMDALSTGLGVASDIASGVGSAMPAIGDAISGIASGIGSIFASKADFDDFVRYAYPTAEGEGDLEPHTHPFAGSGYPGPLEFGTSEEYADKARKKADDVTDLGSGDLTKPMGEWQKQSAYSDADRSPIMEEDDFTGTGWNGDPSERKLREEYSRRTGEDPWGVSFEDDSEDGPYREASYAEATDDGSDIVRAFQAHLGETALGAGAGQGAGRFDDIAGAAQGFLRTAGRNYSLAEQSELIREGDKGGARNLDSLDLRNTHYEDMHTLGW